MRDGSKNLCAGGGQPEDRKAHEYSPFRLPTLSGRCTAVLRVCGNTAFVLGGEFLLGPGPGNQIWPKPCRQAQTLLTPPALYLGMVPRQKGLRDRLTLPDFRSGEVRAVEQTIHVRVKAVIGMAVWVMQDPRLQPRQSIQKRHGRNFPTRQNKVTQADVHIHMGMDKALIDAFITPAQQYGTGR